MERVAGAIVVVAPTSMTAGGPRYFLRAFRCNLLTAAGFAAAAMAEEENFCLITFLRRLHVVGCGSNPARRGYER